MSKKSVEYLSYVEETKKHHALIGRIVRRSGPKAIKDSYANSVEVTYLEGENIVKVSKSGKKSVLGTVTNNRRKVTVGETTELS